MAVWEYFLEGFCDGLVEGLLRSHFVGPEQLIVHHHPTAGSRGRTEEMVQTGNEDVGVGSRGNGHRCESSRSCRSGSLHSQIVRIGSSHPRHRGHFAREIQNYA